MKKIIIFITIGMMISVGHAQMKKRDWSHVRHTRIWYYILRAMAN
jgi:hypothetical protein